MCNEPDRVCFSHCPPTTSSWGPVPLCLEGSYAGRPMPWGVDRLPSTEPPPCPQELPGKHVSEHLCSCPGSASCVGCMTDRTQELLTVFPPSFLRRTSLLVKKLIDDLSPEGCGPHSLSGIYICLYLPTLLAISGGRWCRGGNGLEELRLDATGGKPWPVMGQGMARGPWHPKPAWQAPRARRPNFTAWRASPKASVCGSLPALLELPLSVRSFQKVWK